MRLPKLPARKASEEYPEPLGRAETASDQQPAPGYHETPTPNLPPPPLTADLTKSIRFTVSEPQGYYFEQVESFVQQVIDTLAYHEQAEYRFRQTIYEMQIEADQQAYDTQRLRSEIELFKVQGSPLVNPDGTYITESQQASSEALAADLDAAQTALAHAQQAVVDRDAEIARLAELASAQDQEIVSLRQWGEEMVADAVNLRSDIEALTSEVQSLHEAAAVPAPQEEVEHHQYAHDHIPVPVPVPAPVADPVAVPVPVPAPVPVTVPVDEFPAVVDPGTSVITPAPVTAPVDVEPAVVADPLVEEQVVEDSVAVEPVAVEPAVAIVEAPLAEEQVVEEEPVAVEPVAAEEQTVDLSAVHEERAAVEPLVSEEPLVEEQVVAEALVEEPDIEEPVADEAPVAGLAVEDQSVETYDPYAEFDRAIQEDPSEASAPVVPVDSELPEGAELPGTGEAAITYPPAAPGLPIDTHGVPVEMWAPELNPAARAAIEGDESDAR